MFVSYMIVSRNDDKNHLKFTSVCLGRESFDSRSISVKIHSSGNCVHYASCMHVPWVQWNSATVGIEEQWDSENRGYRDK